MNNSGYLLAGVGPTPRRRDLCSLLLLFAFAGPQVNSPSLASAAAPEERPLGTVEAIRKLTPEEAANQHPVRLQGVVTYYDPQWSMLFFQDETEGIYVFPPPQRLELQPGDRVIVEGVSGPGEYAPVVQNSRFQPLGRGSLPTAKPRTFDQLASGREDSQWVEVVGVVRSMAIESDHLNLSVAVGADRIRTVVPGWQNQPLPHQLWHAKVRLHGACGSSFNQNRQLLGVALYVPSLAQVQLLEAPAADPSVLPSRPIGSLLQFRPRDAGDRPVKIHGTVTLRQADGTVFLEDATGGVKVQTIPGEACARGDAVDVVGFPALGDYGPVMQDARIFKHGVGLEPTPAVVDPLDILVNEGPGGFHHARLVRIAGRLLNQPEPSDHGALVLQAGEWVFSARLDAGTDRRSFTRGLRKDSELELTGVCSVKADEQRQPRTFAILLRSPTDVRVLRAPPWWTSRRLAGALSLLAVLSLAGGGWLMTLRRQVREQTQLIRLRLEREAALEERYRKLFENAADVVYTHDLQGTFTSINPAGERLLGLTNQELRALRLSDVVTPASLAMARQMTAGKVTGEPRTTFELELRHRSGHTIVGEVNSWLLWEDGHPVGVQGIVRDITQRKRAEQRLKETEELYRRAIAVADAVPYRRDYGTETYTFMGDGILQMTGYSAAEMTPAHWDSLVQEVILKGEAAGLTTEEAVQRARAGRLTSWQVDCRIRTRSGKVRWVADSSIELLGDDGRAVASIGILQDITERKRIEEALRLDESRLEALLRLNQMSAAPIQHVIDFALEEGVRLTKSTVGYLAFLNEDETVLTMHSWSKTAMAACAIQDKPLVYPVATTGLWGEAVRQRKPVITNDYAAPNPLKRGYPEGHVRITRHLNVPVFEGERIVAVAGVGNKDDEYVESDAQQLTLLIQGMWRLLQRKEAEEALRRAEAKYRSIFEQAGEGIFQTSPEGRFLSANPALARIYGYDSPADLLASVTDVANQLYMVPQQRERLQRRLEQDGGVREFESQVRRKDGAVAWISENTHEVRDAEGRLLYYEGSVMDITERKRAELALRQSEERFAKAFHASPTCEIISTFPEGRCVDANDNFLRMLGRARDEVLGRTDVELGLWADAEQRARIMATLAEGGPVRDLECQFCTQGGELRTGLTSVVVIDVNGERCLLYNLHDVTERVHLESQLRQAQRMESVGQLAAGVAHDFNNLLTVIQGHTGLLLAAGDLSPAKAESLRQVSGAAERAATLTRQLLTFSRRQVMQPRHLDLNETIRNVSKMLLRLLGEHITLTCEYATVAPSILADPGMIEQVLVNLAVNARDAMPRGGELTVRSQVVTLDAGQAKRNPEARPGEFVRLSVLDTGCGMDGATRSRIFEPFFTTKEVGKGTGLGLATTYGIVKQHQGWIEVASELGQGSRFEVYLPHCQAPAGRNGESSLPAPIRGGKETILTVEDEASLLRLVQGVLERYGYRVLSANHGPAATAVWNEHRGQIDLLLTDMVMPGGLSGRELAQTLRSQKPDLKVILTSGYSVELLQTDTVSRSGLTILQKPYSPETLLRAVREALDRRAA